MRVPIDLVCVIDHSSSMAGEKIKLVKESLYYLLEIMNENDKLCLILFNNTAQAITNLINVSKGINMNIF